MKFITKNKLLSTSIVSAIKKYDKIYIAVAWATCHETSKILLDNSSKIQKLIVGTDREVTSPEFLKKFKNLLDNKLKIIHQSQELFHSKLYLFTNNEGNEWSLFIGSANFTKNAFSSNHESMMLITNEDSITHNILQEQFKCLQEYETIAFPITDKFLEKYTILYNKPKKHDTLYDPYLKVSLQKLSPQNYTKFVMLQYTDNGMLWYDERIKLLNEARQYFREIQNSSLEKENNFVISIEKLKTLIGLVNERDNIYWHHFGHMRTSESALHELQSVIHIVNKIPFSGEITFEDYNSYMEKILSIDRIGLSIATRILALKRPDFFFCVTGANTHRFKRDFNYLFHKKSKDDYWKLVSEDLPSCNWYKKNNTMPAALWNSRVAMLDTILYKGNKSI